MAIQGGRDHLTLYRSDLMSVRWFAGGENWSSILERFFTKYLSKRKVDVNFLTQLFAWHGVQLGRWFLQQRSAGAINECSWQRSVFELPRTPHD